MKGVVKEVLQFFRGHWPHVSIGVPGLVAFTILHELAHCVAVWLQGGTVTEFVWLPSAGEWGHMRYDMSLDVPISSKIVSLSPYIFEVGSVFSCLGILTMRQAAWSFPVAVAMFCWLYIAPVGDLLNAVLPVLVFWSHQ